MDLASVLDMLDRTLADRLDAISTFETANDSVRVRLSVEDRFFSADIKSTTGDAILVTPGQVTATDGTNTFDAINVDTFAALTAWKAQPPTSYSPIAAGLAQLTTANSAINQIISRLAGFSGSLGLGLFPALCWYTARYPSLTVGDVKFTDVVGRICISDVVLSANHVAFSLSLSGTASTCRITTAVHVDSNGHPVGEDFLSFSNVDLSINVSVDMDLVAETADVTFARVNLDTNQFGFQVGDVTDPWVLSANSGISVEIENLRQKLNLSPGAQLSTKGLVRLTLPSCALSKNHQLLGHGAAINYLAPLNAADLIVELEINTVTGETDRTRGSARLSRLDFRLNYSDDNLSLQGVSGVLQPTSLAFGPSTFDVRFDLFGAQISEISLPTGPTSLERLIVQGNTVDISGHISSTSNRTILFFDELHFASAQGSWKLVLEAANSASTTDPLSLIFASGGNNAIDLLAQQLLSCSDASKRITAERLELRVRAAQTASPITQLVLTEHHELTAISFQTLRTAHVPETVLKKLETPLIGVRFRTRLDLLSEVQRRLTTSEFSTHGASIDNSANHHQTYLSNAQLDIEGICFRGSLLESAPNTSRLDGELLWTALDVQFTEIVGLEIPNCSNLTQVTPINSGDRYQITDVRIVMPQGTFLAGVAAFSQQFATVTVDLGGPSIIANSGQNRLRFSLLPQMPALEAVAGQVSIPSASVNTGQTTVTLSNVFVDAYRKQYAPSIDSAQRTILAETNLKFGVVVDPIQFDVFHGSDQRISIVDAGIGFLKTLLAAAGVNVAHEFDVIVDALHNPATRIAGDILGVLGDVTGFGIDDFGILVRTHDVTAKVEGSPDSNRERIAVSVRFRFPAIGAWVTYRYRVPKLGIPPWEDKHEGPKDSPVIDPFPVDIKLMLLISYKINIVTHSIDITDFRIKVVPATGTPVDLLLSEAENLFDAMVPSSIIREKVVQELNRQFRLAFPDSLNFDLARIDFDTTGRSTISVEARQIDWNPL